jgi:acetyl esterase/lipase
VIEWGQMSRAERDAAYNNTRAVANSPALNLARAEASAAFRATVPGSLDVPYGPRERQRWDIFPVADPAAPCFVFIHGGYWQRNRREDFCCLGEGLRAHGWSVALPGYTLAPDATMTEIAAEITAALDHLAAHGAEHGIAGPVLLSGWSAGGHLTAMSLGHARVAAGLAISGIYELGPIRDTELDEKLRLTDEEVVALSPLRLPHSPKTLAVTYGTAELPPLVDDSRALHAARSAQHLPGSLVPAPGANHFTIVEELRRPDGLLVRAAIEALR